jgi:glycosyltransferase involved in cell wall biosynthesis
MTDGRAHGSTASAGTDASARRIAILVFNAFTNDSRVLNVARTFADAGDDVVVLAVEVGDVPGGRSVSDGVPVVRLPFDPVYRRLWDARATFLRPWRHGPEIAGSVRRRAEHGGIGGIATAVATVLLGIPWTLFSAAYHAGARVALGLRSTVGRKRTRRGAWLEDRYKRLLFLAPHAVRVVTWSREVMRAYARRRLMPANVWHANDLETLPVALALRRRYGGRVVYDSHEVWMAMPGPSGMGRLRRWLLARAEAWMARSADARVTINEALADELQRRWSSERPVVVRSLPRRWIPPEGSVSPLDAALEAHGIEPGRRTVLYHGNLSADRGIEPLITAAEGVDGAALAFLGGGSLEATLDGVATRPAWRGRMAILPPVPPDDVIPWVAGADIAACLIEPTTINHRLSSPNKLYQAIAAGVPVLASDTGPIREDVERYDVGITCDPADPPAIAAALASLLGLPAERYEELRANARRAHLDELNWEHESAKLVATYDAVAPRTVAAATAAPVEG